MDISILIPTHNRLWSLPKCINSIHSKNLKLEVIVVDDGSDDGTWEWLQNQKGVISIKQAKWGKPWAVNKAFSLASGQYIKFLDSDDWLLENILESQFELAQKTNCDLVVSGYDIYRNNIYEKTIPWTKCDDFIAQQLGECDSSHYSAFLFKKKFISNIPHRTSFASADFASRDDRCFMLEVALKEPKFEIFDKSGFCHHHHNKDRLQFKSNLKGSATNLQHWLIYRNILNQLCESNKLTTRRIDAAVKILWPLAHWIAKDSLYDAEEIINWIYQYKKNFSAPEKGILGLLYNRLGFKKTEKILSFRRKIKSLI